MADIQIPVDLGFTEFVTSLLSEVLQSVVAAQSDQEERRRELLEAITLSVEEFAALHVDDADVDVWLAQLFPPTAPDRPHDAASGTPYTPGDERTPESPPYAQVLGVELPASAVSPETGHLRAAGARRLAAAARLSLAERQLRTARELAERGLPRVIVDAGRISAKVTFEALQFRDEDDAEAEEADDGGRDGTEPAGDSTTTRVSALRGRKNPLVMGGRLGQLQRPAVVPQVLRDVRLRVHTADERSTDTGSSRASVYGEVELTFKTVT